MKISNAPLLAALAALVVLVTAVASCGSGRVPEQRDTFIAQCTWTLGDYEKKADELARRAETMQSPFREDALFKIEAVYAKVAEGRAKLEEFKTATGGRQNALINEISAIFKELASLNDDAATAVSDYGH